MPKILAVLFLSISFSFTAPLAAQTQLAPPSPEAQKVIQAAVEKAKAGDLPGAIALLEPLRGKPGAHPAALSLLGSLYLRSGRPQDALAVLGPVADLEAAGPVILYNAAQASLAAGDAAKAEAYLRRAAAKAPDSSATRELGLLLVKDGRLDQGYGLLRPWALSHPDDSEARLAAAFAAVELQRVAEGEELLQGAPKDNPRIQILRARLLALEKAPQGAIALLEPLARTAPPELLPEVRRSLAWLYLDIGAAKKAVGLLQGTSDGDPTLTLLLGRAQSRSGDSAGAVRTLEALAKAAQAAKEPPPTPGDRTAVAELEIEYGQALLATSRGAEAIPALDLATRLDPRSAPAWKALAEAQTAAGQPEAAAKSQAQAKELGEKP